MEKRDHAQQHSEQYAHGFLLVRNILNILGDSYRMMAEC